MNPNKLKAFIIKNIVPIIFIIIIAIGIPLSGYSANYLIQEIITRLARNSFLVIALLIPIIAGMGLNFAIVLGAMAGQLGIIILTNYNIVGFQGLFLGMIISIPIAVLLGIFGGAVLNRAKGREMITSLILGFFMNGIYQLVVLYGMGRVIPISNKTIILSRGYGVRNAIDLINIRQVMDKFCSFKIGEINIPITTFLFIALFCLFIVWFRKTKLGQDMKAIGQDMEVARAAGIPVEKTRILAIVISTVLAGFGQIMFLQNIGTMNTYNSHEQIGMFSIAALLIGGASVVKASISNVFIGIILFHALFIVSPMAGKQLLGDAQLGEFFRSFVSYGVIALALVLYEWQRYTAKKAERNQARQKHSKTNKNIKVQETG